VRDGWGDGTMPDEHDHAALDDVPRGVAIRCRGSGLLGSCAGANLSATCQQIASIAVARCVEDSAQVCVRQRHGSPRVLSEGGGTGSNPVGLVVGDLAVSARVLPLYRRGERVERVVAIAFEADAWRRRSVASAR
jgi:hypothetical protein